MLEVFSMASFNEQKDDDRKHKCVYAVKFSRKRPENQVQKAETK